MSLVSNIGVLLSGSLGRASKLLVAARNGDAGSVSEVRSTYKRTCWANGALGRLRSQQDCGRLTSSAFWAASIYLQILSSQPQLATYCGFHGTNSALHRAAGMHRPCVHSWQAKRHVGALLTFSSSPMYFCSPRVSFEQLGAIWTYVAQC